MQRRQSPPCHLAVLHVDFPIPRSLAHPLPIDLFSVGIVSRRFILHLVYACACGLLVVARWPYHLLDRSFAWVDPQPALFPSSCYRSALPFTTFVSFTGLEYVVTPRHSIAHRLSMQPIIRLSASFIPHPSVLHTFTRLSTRLPHKGFRRCSVSRSCHVFIPQNPHFRNG